MVELALAVTIVLAHSVGFYKAVEFAYKTPTRGSSSHRKNVHRRKS